MGCVREAARLLRFKASSESNVPVAILSRLRGGPLRPTGPLVSPPLCPAHSPGSSSPVAAAVCSRCGCTEAMAATRRAGAGWPSGRGSSFGRRCNRGCRAPRLQSRQGLGALVLREDTGSVYDRVAMAPGSGVDALWSRLPGLTFAVHASSRVAYESISACVRRVARHDRGTLPASRCSDGCWAPRLQSRQGRGDAHNSASGSRNERMVSLGYGARGLIRKALQSRLPGTVFANEARSRGCPPMLHKNKGG